MLTCRDVTERTTDYLERTQSLREAMAMRLHLALCASCRAHLEQLRKTIRLLRGRPLAPPPADVAARIAAAAASRGDTPPDESRG